MAQLNDLLVLSKANIRGGIQSKGDHDFLAHSNEFTFASAGYSGDIYINYRTASGNYDGSISGYRFVTGNANHNLAPIYASSYESGSWNGSTISVSKGGTGTTTFTSGAALIGNGTGAISTKAIRNTTAISALGWTSTSADDVLVTANTIAYWNGAYAGTISNLAYCNQGPFGSMATQAANAYLPIIGGTLTGKLKLGASAQTGMTQAIGYHIHDLRSATVTEDTFGDFAANFYFDNRLGGGGEWRSALHVHGWHAGYAAWQLSGGANTSVTNTLYYRELLAGTPGTWYSIPFENRDNSFTGVNMFKATTSYNTTATQYFKIGDSTSMLVFGADGMQCFKGTSDPTAAKEVFLQYYGGGLQNGSPTALSYFWQFGDMSINKNSANTGGGNLTIQGRLTQGSTDSDSSIASMNRFENDVYVAGNGSAPNTPKIAGFYLGKSQTDNNRHMDIVSGGDYSYIDFNKASNVNDYTTRLIANVSTGLTEFSWGSVSNPQLNINGRLVVNNSEDVSLSSASGAFRIGNINGEHLAMDGNEIMAKSNASTASTLYLNAEGGTVQIGGDLTVSNGITGSLTGNATTASYLKPHSSKASYQASIWNGAAETDSTTELVWSQAFTASATTGNTDSGDLVLKLRKKDSSNTELCILIDGDYYSMGNKVLHAGNYTNYVHNLIGTKSLGIMVSNSNEVSFASNSNYIYFGYDNRWGCTSKVDTYRFGTHSGVGGSTSGIIECGRIRMKNYGNIAARDAISNPAAGEIFFVYV